MEVAEDEEEEEEQETLYEIRKRIIGTVASRRLDLL